MLIKMKREIEDKTIMTSAWMIRNLMRYSNEEWNNGKKNLAQQIYKHKERFLQNWNCPLSGRPYVSKDLLREEFSKFIIENLSERLLEDAKNTNREEIIDFTGKTVILYGTQNIHRYSIRMNSWLELKTFFEELHAEIVKHMEGE